MNVNVNLMVENVIKFKSGIKVTVKASLKIKKHCVCKKDYVCNPATCCCKMANI